MQVPTRKIDFLIIGAQKAGTTSLYEYLGQHPEIFLPELKELHYFSRNEFYNQGERYLNVYYKRAKNESLLGGANAQLLYFSQAARRIQEYNPRMKLIAVLRNPIDRAYSAYWFARSRGTEKSPSFEEALAKEAERARRGYTERAELTYLGHGRYGEQLAHYCSTFGRDHVLTLLSEDLDDATALTVARTLRWLGLSEDISAIDMERRANVSGMPRFRLLQTLLRSGDSWPKRTFRRFTSPQFRYHLMRFIRRPLLTRNIRPYRYPPMDPDTRARLADHFTPLNSELGELIGRDLSHWK